MTDQQSDVPLRVVSDARPRVTDIIGSGVLDGHMTLDSRDGWIVEVTAAYVVATRFDVGADPDDPETDASEVWVWSHAPGLTVHTAIPLDS